MMGMELWRPDWFKLAPGVSDMRANELISVTRGTAQIASALMREAMSQDYYHTTAAAARELQHALSTQERNK